MKNLLPFRWSHFFSLNDFFCRTHNPSLLRNKGGLLSNKAGLLMDKGGGTVTLVLMYVFISDVVCGELGGK